MEAPDGRSGGILVLRAWLEGGMPQAVRVRITTVVGPGEPATVVSSSVEGACAIVWAWLTDVLGPGGAPDSDAGSPPG